MARIETSRGVHEQNQMKAAQARVRFHFKMHSNIRESSAVTAYIFKDDNAV